MHIRKEAIMYNVINIDEYRGKSGVINLGELKQNSARRLTADLIAPAQERVEYEIAPEHDAEPVKSMDDIFRISEYLIKNKIGRAHV